MEIDTAEGGSPSLDAHFNCEIEFSSLKRKLLVFLALPVMLAGVALNAVGLFSPGLGAILALPAIFLVIFGLWMPYHAVFGYAEVWRFESHAVTRVRRNVVWKREKQWAYSAIKNVRFKAEANRVRPELLIQGQGWQGKGWLPLPAQADQDTAERLKILIADFKREAMSREQA